MKIKFIGTGKASDYKNGNSAALVRADNTTFLIDAGLGVFEKLHQNDWLDKIDYILLTHLHGDHIATLFHIIVHRKHELGLNTTILYPTESFKVEIEKLLTLMFQIDNVKLLQITTEHPVGFVDINGTHIPGMPGFSYYFTDQTELIYYSGDTKDITLAKQFLANRSESKKTIFFDTSATNNPVHAYYKDIEQELTDYKVYGYHCTAAEFPADRTVSLVEEQPEFLL